MPTPGIVTFTVVKSVVPYIQKLLPSIPLKVIDGGTRELTSSEMNVLQTAEVLFVDPNLLSHHKLLYKLPNLKWMHSSFAGNDSIIKELDAKKGNPTFILSKSDIYGNSLAQHVVGHIVAFERHFAKYVQDQSMKIWTHPTERDYRDISSLSIGVLGFGNCGKAITKAAKGFEMKTIVMVQSVTEDKKRCSYVDEFRLSSDLEHILKSCDYICNVLPSTSKTDGILDNDVLSHCKDQKPVFINVGRANVIRDSSILKALNKKWIRHAILDVFEIEPLPQESELWTHPNVTITPHIAGLSGTEIAERFVELYLNFTKGIMPETQIKWDEGY